MTNPDCKKRNRRGDCLTRDCRVLCDVCADQLSEDEHQQREIRFLAAKLRSKAGSKPGCKRQGRTCIALKMCGPCPGCIAGMSERQLTRYAKALYLRSEEQRRYWDEYVEAQEYAQELRAQGVTGIDWNIELTDVGDLTERAHIINGLFLYGRPCFIHAGGEGLLRP